MMARRIMRNFVISEVSCVDSPAQAHAKAVILKRAEVAYNTVRAAASNSVDKPKGYENMSLYEIQKMIQKAGEIAEETLQLKAEALRKSEPHLTEAQAFSKIYCDPRNVHLRRAERNKNGFSEAYLPRSEKRYPPVARTEPAVEPDMAMGKLKESAAEMRRQNPFLTPEQAFARIYSAPENRELVRAERNAAYSLMGGVVTNIPTSI
jgi:hypothetical protein